MTGSGVGCRDLCWRLIGRVVVPELTRFFILFWVAVVQ